MPINNNIAPPDEPGEVNDSMNKVQPSGFTPDGSEINLFQIQGEFSSPRIAPKKSKPRIS